MQTVPTSTNLVRTFDQNHDALMGMLNSEDFDAIEFNHLISKREEIVDEILSTQWSEEQLRSIHTKHEFLEHQFSKTRNQLEKQLKQMDTGKKALQAYR